MTEEINKGCEFQSGCIEYKDISYLKIMPICAIHELSIACHDKVNKCKYYKLYKQLSSLEQENKELKEKKDKYYQQTLDDEILMNELSLEVDLRKKESDFYLEKLSKYRSALEEIKNIIINDNSVIIDKKAYFELQCGEPIALKLQKIYNKINEVINENN